MAIRDLKIHMPTVYNSSYEDMGKRVRDKYATGTEQTQLQWVWLRLKNVMTIEQFRALDVTFAEAMDGTWAYEAPGNLVSGYQNTFSKVILPKGRFLQNANGNLPRGGMIGEGSFGYGGNGADQGQVASEFEARPDEWITSGERRMWSTPNADRTDNMAYNEGLDLYGVRLTLPIKKGDGITRVGWYLKRLGSTSYVNAVQANGGGKGFVFVDGVPAVVGTIRAFYSDIAGASFEGTWGADITITKLECDGCVRPFQVLNTSDGNGGGVLRIGLKVEDGVTANIPWPGSYCYLEGQYDVEVSMNASFKGGMVPAQGALFVVNPIIMENGKPNVQGSRLRVSGKGFGYGKVLKSLVTGRVIEGAGDYQGFSFEHYANGDKFHSNCPTLVNDQRSDAPVPPPVQPPPSGTAVELVRTGWSVTASPNPAASPASNMLDGNVNSRWSTGRSQRIGDSFVLSLNGNKANVCQAVLDAGNSFYDFPAGFKVEYALAETPTTWRPWTTGVGSAVNNNPLTTIKGTTITAGFLRFTLTAGSANYWSVMEVHVYANA